MNVKKIFDLTNKTVILTGAAGYLGANYVDGLSQSGANVVLADINYQRCKKLEHKIREKYDVDPLSVKLDLTQPKSINNLVSKITKKYSNVDVLINNAAYQGTPKIRTAGFENLTLETWNEAISVNLTGIFLLSQRIGEIMKNQKFGNIINISSIYGIVGADQRIYGKTRTVKSAMYAVTKSSVLNFTRYLASYWREKSIRVNTLTPGGVFDKNNHSPNFVKKYSERTILNRMANQDE